MGVYVKWLNRAASTAAASPLLGPFPCRLPEPFATCLCRFLPNLPAHVDAHEVPEAAPAVELTPAQEKYFPVFRIETPQGSGT